MCYLLGKRFFVQITAITGPMALPSRCRIPSISNVLPSTLAKKLAPGRPG